MYAVGVMKIKITERARRGHTRRWATAAVTSHQVLAHPLEIIRGEMATVLAHSHSKEEQQKLWGSVALLIYMVVWVCSLISPLIVMGLIYLQLYVASST